MNTNHARDLRKVLEENKFLTLSGVYDCLSARIAEEAGFPALFLSGGELIKVSEESKIPLMVNMNEKGFVGGNVAIEQIREMNFSIGLFPISSMLAASQGMIEVMEALASQGTTLGVSEKMTNPPTRIHSMMGQFSLVEKYSPYYDR